MEMEKLSESEIKRLLNHIEENDLDYQYVDNGVFRPFLLAYDNTKYFLSKNEGSIVLTHYDSSKDKPGSNGAYQHTVHPNLMQVLEAITMRDMSLHKSYWELTSNSIEVPFDKSNYVESWHEEFLESDGYTKEEDSLCTYVVFESDEYEPEIMSPWNTLGSDSIGGLLHESRPNRLNKLRFEIHPIGTAPGSETYLFKIRCNEDDAFPENICYKVVGKKGLRLIRQNLFNEMKRFKKQ
jgi:hypothetical protein